ncbi:RnfH family protein [Acinetobacter larvae]|uniref:UPF0125 protein BFG52_12490 n=1 Tax=Acinetobacter larvae TaxID=1789224 RepID=A0A1B2M1M0_9GAMM|nr:RnfH family protein [Acinetobacter larvae]AOA59088.1 hypothetical protein BFG52_12490 [Acinetobacter larvae]
MKPQQVASSAKQRVWLAYADENIQHLIELPYRAGMTVQDVIDESAILQHVVLPESVQYGIWQEKISNMLHVVQPGDRVEIYRALRLNPKDIRRKRASANPLKPQKQGNRFKQFK